MAQWRMEPSLARGTAGASAWWTAPGPIARACVPAAIRCAGSGTTSRSSFLPSRIRQRPPVVERTNVRLVLIAGLATLLFVPGPAIPQQQVVRVAAPRGEPVAETRLLMQGIAMPNFHGLDALLHRNALDTEAW